MSKILGRKHIRKNIYNLKQISVFLDVTIKAQQQMKKNRCYISSKLKTGAKHGGSYL
jgi:hypothetical protein